MKLQNERKKRKLRNLKKKDRNCIGMATPPVLVTQRIKVFLVVTDQVEITVEKSI